MNNRFPFCLSWLKHLAKHSLVCSFCSNFNPTKNFEQMLIFTTNVFGRIWVPDFNTIEAGLLEDMVHVKHCAEDLAKHGEKKKKKKKVSPYHREFWFFWCPHFHPEPRVVAFVPCSYLFCSQHRSFDLPEDVSSHRHTEGPVDTFHRVRVAREIQQHLSVVEQGGILLIVSEEPKEELSHAQSLTKDKIGSPWWWRSRRGNEEQVIQVSHPCIYWSVRQQVGVTSGHPLTVAIATWRKIAQTHCFSHSTGAYWVPYCTRSGLFKSLKTSSKGPAYEESVLLWNSAWWTRHWCTPNSLYLWLPAQNWACQHFTVEGRGKGLLSSYPSLKDLLTVNQLVATEEAGCFFSGIII